ncbi:H-NS histone family protein [Acidovorax delafieldii]
MTEKKSSKELLAEAESLFKQAQEVRQQEVAAIIADIKEQIKTHELRPEDLFPGITKTHTKANGRQKREPRYRGPNGQTWGGGSGRKPDWVREVEAKGESLDKYLINK